MVRPLKIQSTLATPCIYTPPNQIRLHSLVHFLDYYFQRSFLVSDVSSRPRLHVFRYPKKSTGTLREKKRRKKVGDITILISMIPTLRSSRASIKEVEDVKMGGSISRESIKLAGSGRWRCCRRKFRNGWLVANVCWLGNLAARVIVLAESPLCASWRALIATTKVKKGCV